METHGALIDGTYGHTSVWDPESLLVFVHGGLRTSYANSVVSDLVTYDPFKHKWYVFTMQSWKIVETNIILDKNRLI